MKKLLLTSAMVCGIMTGPTLAQDPSGVGGCIPDHEAVKMLERAKFYKASIAVDEGGLLMVLMYVNEDGDFIFFTSDVTGNMCQVGTGSGYQAFKIGRAI